ncbi:MAG: HEAT repeat domain-containing protein [Tissierellales bacterium]|nr:HEAT repeat domain-containing protein [Tissierellales bacterium]
MKFFFLFILIVIVAFIFLKTKFQNISRTQEAMLGLKSQNPQARISAAKTIEQIGPDAIINAKELYEALCDEKDASVRTHLVKSLSSIGPSIKNMIPHLSELLSREKDTITRFYLIHALPAIGLTKDLISGSEGLDNRIGLLTLKKFLEKIQI